MLTMPSSRYLGTILDHNRHQQTPNDTNRRSQALQKAVQGCVAAPVDIEWHLLESVGVFWCLTASFSVLWCLEMWGGCLASFWKGIWVLVMDVFKVWVPPREHLSVQALYGATNALYWKCFKRQNSTHLTPLKHQNTKTSLYKLSKNHWVITLFEFFGSVRRDLQSTVSLDHPVDWCYY